TVPRQTSNELGCPCELSNSPCLYLTAESDSAEFTSNPDGSNARTIWQIRQVRIWRVTGMFLVSSAGLKRFQLEPTAFRPRRFITAAGSWGLSLAALGGTTAPPPARVRR